MSISGSIHGDSVVSEPSLVATNKSYFSKSNRRTESDVLTDKFIVPNNLWGAPGTCQHDTHFSGATNSFHLLFVASKRFVDDSRTGESDTANEMKYVSIQETFVGNTLKCNNLNESVWT